MNSTREIYISYSNIIKVELENITKNLNNLEERKQELRSSKITNDSDHTIALNIVINQIKELRYKKERLYNYNVSYKVFNIILSSFNFEISKFILEGYKFNLPGTMKGTLMIIEVNNTSDKRVDWDASNKYKEQLLKEGKSLYNSVTNTKGVKWLIYHIQSFNYWWTWRRPIYSKYEYFTFRPSNGCNTKNRKQEEFIQSCNTKEDILNTTHLGNTNKMFSLLKFDSLQFIKYRNNRVNN